MLAIGNTTYQDWAWEAFVAINATTRVGQGFSEINDVNVAGGGGFTNIQESFLFAEVLKYSYLIHAPVSMIQDSDDSNTGLTSRQDSVIQTASKDKTNQFVFNTEAHPLRVVGPPV